LVAVEISGTDRARGTDPNLHIFHRVA
jgi:hypothetical protein